MIRAEKALTVVPDTRKTYGHATLVEEANGQYVPFTYGQRPAWWKIEAEPQVMIKLKRLFGRTDVRQFGSIRLRATDEVCRDLQWFCERYPLGITPRDHLDKHAALYEQQKKAFSEILSGEISPRKFDLAIPAREYQKVASELWLQSKGVLVADDVGIGKTLVAIAALTQPETRPALVVTLSHLPIQWEREIKKFAPGLKTHIIKKGAPYDVTLVRGHKTDTGQGRLFADRFPDVLITNYHKLAGWAETLGGKIRGVVFDECQELRRVESQKYAAAKHIAEHAGYVLGTSATPIYNYGDEMFNVLSVIRRDVLGTREEFLREWCTGAGWSGNAKITNPKAFGSYLRDMGVMIRRTRRDVNRELPPLTKILHYVETDVHAIDAIASDAAELARIILSHNSPTLIRGQASRDLDWKLRQATGIGKALYVANFVKMLVDSGEKVVLFGWHREVYSIWAEQLAEYKPVFFTGTESPKQKDSAREAFCGGDASILIMSLRAGAGLDGLQYHARTVVVGELDWSPGVHEQNEGRILRDGQVEPVVIYYMLSEEGSDPVVADTLGLKRSQIDGIRDPNAELVEKLEVDSGRIKQLAAAYLKQRGLEHDN